MVQGKTIVEFDSRSEGCEAAAAKEIKSKDMSVMEIAEESFAW